MNAVVSDTARPMPHVMNTYGRLPIALSHGQGSWVWDTQGKRYLDGLAGIAVSTLGHNHPKLVPALHDQVSKLIHCSNYYEVPLQEQLATRLVEFSGLENAFFCSTGLEANEAALKLARKFGHDKGIERPEIEKLRAFLSMPRPEFADVPEDAALVRLRAIEELSKLKKQSGGKPLEAWTRQWSTGVHSDWEKLWALYCQNLLVN